MKEKIKCFLIFAWDEITYGLRCALGKPSRMKRFIVISILGILFCIGYFYSIISSIYNTGKQDAKKEFLEFMHIEGLKLQQKQDSVDIIRNYELGIRN